MHRQSENGSTGPFGLNKLIQFFWEKAASSQEPEYFDFVKIHDRIIMSEIKKYSACIRKMDSSDSGAVLSEDTVENMSADLFDSITAANMDYLRHGMKIGARLLAELVI